MADRGGSSAAAQAAAEPARLRTVGQYLAKMRQGEAAKWEKDELLNVIYWWRQIAGVLIGLAVGFTKFTGFTGIIMFFLSSISVTLGFLKNVLGVDEDEFGGPLELMFEGLMGSFASFMITWILTYTHLQQFYQQQAS